MRERANDPFRGGNESDERGFSDAANCSGIVLAKLDGTAKGGVAIPIRQEFGLPVKFIGFGETAALLGTHAMKLTGADAVAMMDLRYENERKPLDLDPLLPIDLL